jgi:uncharacterized iron-regulated membrane protein
MTLRRILFWLHLSAGSIAGIFILIMCVTGVCLAFERQINAFADSWGRPPVQMGTARLAVDDLMQDGARDTAGLTAVTVSSHGRVPVALAYGRQRIVFVDPYTGKTLGESSKKSRALLAGLERWHRALGAELRSHGPGRPIADAANALFLVLLLSGAVLWWPRKWKRSNFRSVAVWRRAVTGKAAHWNRHHVIAMYCALPLLVVVTSGVIMSYTWANNLLYTLTGSAPPPPRTAQQENGAGGGARHRHRGEQAAERQGVPLQQLFAKAEAKMAGWQSVSLQWTPDAPVAVFQIDRGNGGQPNKRAQLTLDKATGQERRWEPFDSYSTGRQWRAWARFLHTGEAGGMIGQVVATAATLGGVLLVWTGLAMAWIRFRQTIAVNRAAKAARDESPALR